MTMIWTSSLFAEGMNEISWRALSRKCHFTNATFQEQILLVFWCGNIPVRSRCIVDRYSCFTQVNLIDRTLSMFGRRSCCCDWCFEN